MRRPFPVALSLAVVLAAAPLRAQDAADVQVKHKGGRVVVKDKSKPVRKALELQYGLLAQAVEQRDFEAFQALRTADFHTLDEQGRASTPEQMADRARAMLSTIQPPIHVEHTLGTIDVHGSEAKATVRQHFTKMLELDGALRRVETWVTQDETWTLTADGWKLSFVDGERDAEAYVDGKRIEPGKPYDPDAPPYVPPVPVAPAPPK